MRKLVLILFVFWASITFAQYYDSAEGLKEAALKTELHNIINDHTVRTYDNLWTDFQTTDEKADGKVWDMYTDIPGGTPVYVWTFIDDQCGNYSGEGSCYNREHSFPKSWFNDASPMYSELFHIYPTDGYVNGQRSNFPYGEVSSPTYTSSNGSKVGPNTTPGYTGTVFEPIDEYKRGLSLDAQLRAAASRHAHHAAAGAQARRRAGGRCHAGDGLPSLRLRENRRAPHVQPVRDGHRPDELHLTDGQQRGLAPRGRDAPGDRTDAPLQGDPHDHHRTGPNQRPPPLQWGGRPRHRSVHLLPLRLLPAGGDL